MTARLDRAWANTVVHTGLAYTPDQFKAMTRDQRAALVAEANKRR